jgi:tetratricopeptide (TPR) repeat protein
MDESTTEGATAWRRLGDFVTQDGAGFHRFRHALMRDAAYEGLAYRRRRDLHVRAGETIERQRATDDADIDLLALHFFHGRVHDKAWLYSRRAADAAERKFAIVDAAEHLEQALQSARGMVGLADADVAEALEALGDLRERMGQYPDARDAYGRARRLRGGDVVALARLCMKQATVADRGGSYPQALGWLRRGIKLVSGDEDMAAAKQYARLIAEYGVVRQAQGRRVDAVRWLNQAIDAAQRADEREALAQAYFVLDWALVDLGRSDEAVHSQRALELYDELGKLGPQATIYNNLGTFAYYEARWDDAVELFEKARQLRLRLGDEVDAAIGTFNIAEVLSDQGHLDEARPRFEEAARVWRAADYSFGVASVASVLGTVASRSGDFALAGELFDQARDRFTALVSEHDLIDTDARIAEALVLQGRAQDALELASGCLERTAVHGGDTHDPMLYRIRGYAWALLSELDAALAELDRSLEVARARNARYEVALALDAIARVRERFGSADAAARAEADGLVRTLGVVRIAEVPFDVIVATRSLT